MQELQTGRERGHFNNLFCFRNMKMEFLQIKYTSLSCTGWSERYYKWLCRHISSFFASLWERQKAFRLRYALLHCASWWQAEAWMVTQCWHFSSLPVIGPKDLHITQKTHLSGCLLQLPQGCELEYAHATQWRQTRRGYHSSWWAAMSAVAAEQHLNTLWFGTGVTVTQ